MKKNKTFALTVLMLKSHIADVMDTIKEPKVPCVNVDLGGHHIGKLFYKQIPTHPPAWVKLFKPTSEDKLNQLVNSGSAAVLIVLSEKQYFALTFGCGRSLLKPDCFEENFGLRVVLNSVNPEKIRSVDTQSLDAVPLNQRSQASIASPIFDFGLNVEQDLLYAATGQPKDPAFGKRLTGKDALKISIPVVVEDIPKLLTRFSSLYKADAYKESFAWIDNLKEIRQKSAIEKLDAALTEKIQQKNFERTWLSVPDIIDWTDISGFKYQNMKHDISYDDIDWDSYLAFLGTEMPHTAETFRKHYVLAISESSGQQINAWTVYRCIYCELSLDGADYALNNGKWFKVNIDFLNTINESVGKIPVSNLPLPDYSHNKEADYNQAVHQSFPEYFALMDVKNISHGGGHSKIEFCDLYTKDKHLIHVKRYGGSSVLSHLFGQGVVSANLLLSDSNFREKLNEKLPESHKINNPLQKVKAEEFEIVYVIASKGTKVIPDLPLFSKITLRNSFNQLRMYGMKVSLKYVQVKKRQEKV